MTTQADTRTPRRDRAGRLDARLAHRLTTRAATPFPITPLDEPEPDPQPEAPKRSNEPDGGYGHGV